MKTLCNLKWLRFVLVVLFMGYYVGGTAFTHTHYFPTYTITHSHPYLPGADGLPHHNHSTAAFNTIEELTEMYIELMHYSLLGVMAWVLLSVFIQPYRNRTFVRSVRLCNLRDPPYVIMYQ